MAQVLTSIRFNRQLIFVCFLCNYISNKKKQVLNAYQVLHLKSEHDQFQFLEKESSLHFKEFIFFLYPCIILYKIHSQNGFFALIFYRGLLRYITLKKFMKKFYEKSSLCCDIKVLQIHFWLYDWH